MTSPTAAANATATPILEIGRFWMLDEQTAARGDELGMDQPFSFWIHGRAGVLGDVHSDVAAAAIGFVAKEMVADLWHGNAPEGLTPQQRSQEYALAAGQWADATFADIPSPDLDRVTELSARVALLADPSLGVLFAGWRQITLPSTPAGAAAVALNTMREMRGGAHLIATHAVGLGPHGAIVSRDHATLGGIAGAERYGWGDPHPSPDTEKLANAEMLTTLMASHPFDILSESERGEYVELVGQLREAC